MDKKLEKLKVLREAGRRVCEKIIKSRQDIVAVYILGSVARGNIHENSDIDLCVIVNRGEKAWREIIQEMSCNVDIAYAPLRLWIERLQREMGSMWEINVSSILDSIILYDPTGLIRKIKRELSVYPEEKRIENILHQFNVMGWYENAVRYHYLKGNYDYEAIFSKFFAFEALKLLFPLNRTYLKGEKYLFEQVKELKAPPGYVEECFYLLWFKSHNIEKEEATYIIGKVSEIRKKAVKTLRQTGIELPKLVP